MKVKLNLDKNAIKNFFIDHAEKVIFGFVLLGVVMIVYSSAAGREKTDKKPADLVAKVEAAKAKISQTTAVEESTVQVDEIAELNQVEIKVAGYESTKSISPPVGKLEHPRGEPPIVGVEKLRVATGSGMFQIAPMQKAPAADKDGQPQGNAMTSDQRGQRWAVITARVPWKKQCDLYRDTYSDCRHIDPVKDEVPEYKGYWVERVEVLSPGDITNPKIWDDPKRVVRFQSNKEEDRVMKDWGQVGQIDLVEPKYINRNLCFPLGPLSEGAWDASVAHEPEVPLYTANGIGGGMPAPAGDAAPEKKPDADSFEDRAAVPGGGVMGGGMPVGMPVGMPHGGMFGRGGAGMVGGGMAAGQAAADPDAVEYLLFRFFDFTVEPGKRYIYRVQLALSNPNFGVKLVYLAKPDFAQKKILTNAKDPNLEVSPVVSIPHDTSTLAVAVEQPKRLINDPLGSMLVALWKHDTGMKVYNEFAVERGQVLNFTDAEVEIVPGRSTTVLESTTDKTSLLSNVLVVDLAGGKKLPTSKPRPASTEEVTDQYGKKLPLKEKERAAFSPGEILTMELDGRLVVRDEYADMTSVEKLTKMPEAAPGGGRVGPPGFGPGMMPPVGMPPGYGPGVMPPGYGPGVMPPGYGPGVMPPGYGPGMNRGGRAPGGAGGAVPDLFPKAGGKKQ